MRKCYVFFYDGYIAVSGTIINFSQALAKIFDEVFIFAKDTEFERYKFSEKNIKSIYINDYYSDISMYEDSFYVEVLDFLQKQDSLADFCIGVDKIGSIIANELYLKCKIPYFYLSLELPTKYSEPERNSIINAKSLLIQDELRLKYLLGFYDIASKNVFYLPNAPYAQSAENNPDLPNLLSQFQFNNDFPILASIGMIHPFVYSLELASSLSYINGINVIFHDRMDHAYNSAYIQNVQDANTNNLFLSKMLFDFKDIDKVYSPIHIGIALYSDVDSNFNLIGKASGKASLYLKYKKPLIMNELPLISDIIENYKCGVVVKDINNPYEWKEAIETILASYQEYSANAYQCFVEEFAFETYVEPILAHIQTYYLSEKL